MRLKRDEDGRWSLVGMTPAQIAQKRDWHEALPRYLTILDTLFHRAQTAREFDFIHSLLGVRGLSDAGWDPWETTSELLGPVEDVINEAKDFLVRRHLKLWVWGHVVEATEPYELLRNLIEVAQGGRFRIEWFPDVTTSSGRTRPQHPADKIAQIESAALKIGLPDVAQPSREIWDTDLRNAVAHADYVLHGGDVNLPRAGRTVEHEAVERLVSRADAYLGALKTLRQVYVGSYDEPKEISAYGFCGEPDAKGIVIVREGHGAVGMKDALTEAELAAGGIPWMLGRFYRDESELLRANSTLAKLPPRPDAEAG
jgi:hypothetical protein